MSFKEFQDIFETQFLLETMKTKHRNDEVTSIKTVYECLFFIIFQDFSLTFSTFKYK